MNTLQKSGAQTPAKQKVNKLKGILESTDIRKRFEEAIGGKNSGAFIASLIELYSGDNYLQNCDPKEVVLQAMKAASLKLPLNKNLGFAWIIPRKTNKVLLPNFEIGYKGYIQLAMRTGEYRCINAGIVYDGMEVEEDILSGHIKITGSKQSDKILGAFAHFELQNFMKKTIYWSIEKIEEHAKKYSQSYNSNYSPWKQHFDEMAKKTLLSKLIRTYGIMSVEMMSSIAQEKVDEEFQNDDNSIDFETAKEVKAESKEVVDESTGEIITPKRTDDDNAEF